MREPIRNRIGFALVRRGWRRLGYLIVGSSRPKIKDTVPKIKFVVIPKFKPEV